VGQFADPVEVEKEFRAQIERALAFGIKPTHFDTHMASAGATPELFQIYLKLGKEYNTPVLLPRFFLLGLPPEARDEIISEYVLLDNIYMLGENISEKTWSESYKQMIESMKPGLNQLIVHLGFDDEEMKAICIDHDAYGAAWRQKDLDYVLSEEFKEQLKENDIQMVGWKEIKDYMQTKAGAQKAEEMEANLVHVVFFWLKNPDNTADRDKFETSLNNFIDNSKFILSKHIGTPADTDRPVIDNTWTYSLVLGFKNKEEQAKYQDEEVHKKFIEESEELWEKVLVYDSVRMN